LGTVPSQLRVQSVELGDLAVESVYLLVELAIWALKDEF